MKSILFTLLAIILIVYAQQSAMAQSSTPAPAPSQPELMLTGKDLSHFCKGQYDIDYGYCAGYIAAMSEVMVDHEIYGYRACNLGKVAPQTLMTLMDEYFKSRPARQLQPASTATAEILSSFFRCR